MKKLIFFFLLGPLLVAGQNSSGFTINGKLTGFDEGTEIKLIRNGETQEIAKTKLQKGSFYLAGSVVEPVLCFMVIGNMTPVEIYIENSKITYTGDKNQPTVPVITGSSSHKEFKEFINIFVPLLSQLNSLANTINSMIPGPDRESLMKIYSGTQLNIQTEIDKYIVGKSHSFVAPFVLNVTSQFYDDPMLLEKRFLQLDNEVRNTAEGKKLEQLITTNKIGAVGTMAMEFSQPDTTGKTVALSSFRGKYVLLDFWASWCGPCRNENPNVVINFQRFREKNFTVLGVSLDKPGQKDRWLKAIQEDGLTWTHVSDLQFWNNAAAVLYQVHGIPKNFLIDPSGKIVGKDLRGPALEAKLCEIFGCN